MPHSLFLGPPFFPCFAPSTKIDNPGQLWYAKEKEAPGPGRLAKTKYHYGKNRRTHRQPQGAATPHGLRRRQHRPHNRLTLYLSGIIQDAPPLIKRYFSASFDSVYPLCV